MAQKTLGVTVKNALKMDKRNKPLIRDKISYFLDEKALHQKNDLDELLSTLRNGDHDRARVMLNNLYHSFEVVRDVMKNVSTQLVDELKD